MWEFWYFDRIWADFWDKINEKISEAFFSVLDIDFDENIKKRENFDEIIDREIISAQNIDFFDVANEIKESELSKIDFEWSTDDANINVDSFDVNVAKSVDFAIDVILTNFAFISLDVIIAIVMILTNFAFDVSNDVSINVDSLVSHLLIRDTLFLLINFISSTTFFETMSFRTMIAKMFISSNLLFSRT